MEEKSRRKIGLATLFIAIVSLSAFIKTASAATLGVYAADTSLAVGETAQVSILVSSSEQVMNAVSGSVTVDPSILEIIGITKASEAITFWVQEPSYNSTAGTARFEGISLNPGWQGSSATLVTLTVRAKSTGVGRVAFSSGSVLANDGLGTNILTSMGSANITVAGGESVPEDEPQEEEPETPSPVPAAVPGAPRIASVTHPDASLWSNNNDPVFNWSLPADITGVNVLAEQNAGTDIGFVSDGVVTSWSYTDIEDGEWYFKVRLQNQSGWGSLASYLFKVDTTAPENVSAQYVKDPVSNLDALRLSASDSGSGVVSYTISIDGGESIAIDTDDLVQGLWFIPALSAGEHAAVMTVKDGAGNATETTVTFETPPDMSTPVFSDIPSELVSGNTLAIIGRSLPDSLVTIFMTSEDGTEEKFSVHADNRGVFALAWPKRVRTGEFTISAQAEDVAGRVSPRSSEHTLVVTPRGGFEVLDFVDYGFLIATYSALIAVIAYLVGTLTSSRRRMREEVQDVSQVTRQAFTRIKKDLTNEQIELLRDRNVKGADLAHKTELVVEEEEARVEKEIADVDRLITPKRRKPRAKSVKEKKGDA
ncbi:hypothetical protein KBC55_00025 [Patescibacteria group bacterium]|nr:hypothetical protein [Patescibacteria group bacterium]